ncbi:MAG: hypothetical protein ACRDPH_01640 [Marmoricola sp.]
MLSGPGAGSSWSDRGHAYHRPWQALEPGWMEGAGEPLNRLAREIRSELHREPDGGDLLLSLAAMPNTLASDALRAVGVDPDALWATIERVRAARIAERAALERELEEVRAAKEQAIEAQEMEEAAQLRDAERRLRERQRAGQAPGPRALDEVRRRLGIPLPPEAPLV